MSVREIRVAIPGREYPIFVGPGILERASDLVPAPERAELAAIVTDAHVAALHGARATTGISAWNVRAEQLTLEPGEATKDPAVATTVWRWLARTGAHRGDVVVGLGGGVIGDLAGFAAATFHRGIPLVQMPTTLLAQVDAAIGGKTAVDLPEGKNLVGAFHQPLAVLADIDALGTLPDADFATGMAEIIKHAFIADDDLLGRLRVDRDRIVTRDPEVLTALVADAASIKARVVAIDETEQGVRAHLNYGHTLGHAIEALGGYRRWTHGQAVAVGMMFAAALAAELGLGDRVDEHRRVLEMYGLPTGGVGHSFDEVAEAWQMDKKYQSGMRFVVLDDVGAPRVTGDVPDATLRKAFEVVA